MGACVVQANVIKKMLDNVYHDMAQIIAFISGQKTKHSKTYLMCAGFLISQQLRWRCSWAVLKPLPKLGTAADDFDSWALTAGILLSKVLFFSNKRTRL